MMYRSLISYNNYIVYTIYKENIRQLYCYGGNRLAGHSKWANIKHIKALKDSQKSQMFTKLARQIRVAIQDGGSPNPAINSTLQSAIDEAIKKNMPQATLKAVRHTFTEKGVIAGTYEEAIKSDLFDDLCGELAIGFDAEEYEIQDAENNICIFICSPDYLDRIKNSLAKKKWNIDTSEHMFIPNISVAISTNEVNNINSFQNKLKEIDGVEEIYDNLVT